MNLLFLRGKFDKNNEINIRNDTDMWVQLWRELTGDYDGVLWYKGKEQHFEYKKKSVFVQEKFPICDIDIIFNRGGFDWYIPALKYYEKAFKIYYGAGGRYKPIDEIKYDLILVDSYSQLERSGERAQLWIKPAADNFKPMNVEKEYDICYIANPTADNQAKFKRIEWVYDTVPRNLKVLHLGNSWKFKPPKNVTVKRLNRLEMPEWINKCRVGICPYTAYDSAPRALIEMNACGLDVICLEVNIWHDMYNTISANKNTFWDSLNIKIEGKKDFSVKKSVDILKGLICTMK